MASETTLFESAQAIFCAAADYLGDKKADLLLDSKSIQLLQNLGGIIKHY